MTNHEPPDRDEQLDELASEYLDERVDGARPPAGADERVVARADRFATVRSQLHETDDEPGDDSTTLAQQQLSDAMAVFDALYPPSQSDNDDHTLVAAAASDSVRTPSVESARSDGRGAPVGESAVVSLDVERRRRRGRAAITILGVAAAAAVVILGVSRIGSDSNSTSKSSSAAIPSPASPTGTALDRQSDGAPVAAAAATVAASATTTGAATTAAASAATTAATTAGTTPSAAGSVASPPVLSTATDLAAFAAGRVPPSQQETAATTAGTTAASATTAAGTSPPATTTPTFTAGTTPAQLPTAANPGSFDTRVASGTADGGAAGGSASTPHTICATGPNVIDLGPVIWQGQPADVYTDRTPGGAAIATAYDLDCNVLATTAF